MNKYQKALSESVDRQDKENYKILKELVDRSTPVKPIEKILDFCGEGIPLETELHFYCVCGKWVGDEYDKENFCPHCGQAIDWSES